MCPKTTFSSKKAVTSAIINYNSGTLGLGYVSDSIAMSHRYRGGGAA